MAWLLLVGALALHVFDEAANDFLSVYNPAVLAIRERLPFIPLPTFSFDTWLAGLIAGITLLAALSPFAFKRAPWMRPLALFLGVLMAANAGLHISVTVFQGSIMPGTYSAPFLLAAAALLLASATRAWREPARPIS